MKNTNTYLNLMKKNESKFNRIHTGYKKIVRILSLLESDVLPKTASERLVNVRKAQIDNLKSIIDEHNSFVMNEKSQKQIDFLLHRVESEVLKYKNF